jgi:hypothetical protein
MELVRPIPILQLSSTILRRHFRAREPRRNLFRVQLMESMVCAWSVASREMFEGLWQIGEMRGGGVVVARPWVCSY